MKKAKKGVPKVPISRALTVSVFQMYLGARLHIPIYMDRIINMTGINCNVINPWIDGTQFVGPDKIVQNITCIFERDNPYWASKGFNCDTVFIENTKLILRDPKEMLEEDVKNVKLIVAAGPKLNVQYILAHLHNPSILLASDATFGYFKMLQAHHYLVKRMYNMPIPLPFDGAAGKTPVDLGLAILDNII